MTLEYKTNQDYLFLIADRIREYRIAERISQQEIARLAGVSVSLVQRLEQHRGANVTMLNIISLLRALGMEQGLENLLPALPIAPDIMEKIARATPKRIRASRKNKNASL